MTRHNCGFTLYLRKFIAVALCCTWPVSFASAQELSIEPVRPAAPVLWRPYLAPEVPPVILSALRMPSSTACRASRSLPASS